MKYPKYLLLDYGLTFKANETPYWGFKYALINDYQFSLAHNILSKVSKKPKFGFSTSETPKPLMPHSSYDISFLRKEKIYTKLKYSRCPQYDIVSGGLAALLAAFIGFLICEKFGLELLDSGDFYFAFMYGVFFSFSLRPLMRILDKDVLQYRAFSLKPLYVFFTTLLKLYIQFLKGLLSGHFPHVSSKSVLFLSWCADNEMIRPTLRRLNY
jgi:hypothetical protein